MKSKRLSRLPAFTSHLALIMLIAMSATAVRAQANSRFLGTITAITGDTLTVKPDAGEVRQVEVPSTATVKRIAPGQRDLSTAESIQFGDLATGDRVLVRLDPNATGSTPQALQVIAVKQADVALKQQKDREEWQRNGTGGLVKSVDAASGVVMVTSGAGATAKVITVHVAKTTMLKRYAPGSVRFDEAQPASIDAILVGDQLRARGTKNADSTEIAAEEVVSGSFRNISGTVLTIDAANSTLTVKDLVTKKPVTIHVTAETQMRRLPDMMARMIAARLKGGAVTGAGTGSSTVPARPQSGSVDGQSNGSSGGGQFQGRGPGVNGGGDMQQVLSRAPTVQLSELQKDEAVMLVSTQGATDVTAITLMAGVEPLLEAPAASQNLLSNWSMGSGGAEAAAQ
jgi:Domain of unknown function (DUF5666)